MNHRAKCCVCPWETRAESPELLGVAMMRHQMVSRHTRIKIRDRRCGPEESASQELA